MAKRNERTLKMIDGFMPLYNEGHSIEEIASKFEVSVQTVYNYLGEIAEKAGTTRESLLERVFIADHSGQNYTKVKPIDRSGFEKAYNELVDAINDLSVSIRKTIDESELMEQLYEEEYGGKNERY